MANNVFSHGATKRRRTASACVRPVLLDHRCVPQTMPFDVLSNRRGSALPGVVLATDLPLVGHLKAPLRVTTGRRYPRPKFIFVPLCLCVIQKRGGSVHHFRRESSSPPAGAPAPPQTRITPDISCLNHSIISGRRTTSSRYHPATAHARTDTIPRAMRTARREPLAGARSLMRT